MSAKPASISVPAIGPNAAYRIALMTACPVPLAMSSLMRACGIAETERDGPAMIDIARIESVWELIDDESTAHGYVIALRGGRRLYLQYVMTFDEDGIVEEVETLPMTDERYPDLEGGGIAWDDDSASELSGLLMH